MNVKKIPKSKGQQGHIRDYAALTKRIMQTSAAQDWEFEGATVGEIVKILDKHLESGLRINENNRLKGNTALYQLKTALSAVKCAADAWGNFRGNHHLMNDFKQFYDPYDDELTQSGQDGRKVYLSSLGERLRKVEQAMQQLSAYYETHEIVRAGPGEQPSRSRLEDLVHRIYAVLSDTTSIKSHEEKLRSVRELLAVIGVDLSVKTLRNIQKSGS